MSLGGVDIGSSGIRAIAFGRDGIQIAQASTPYPIDTSVPGFVEVEPDEIWHAFVKVIRCLASQTTKDAIEAFALSAHGETFFMVNSTGTPVAKAIMNSDNRAQLQIKAIEEYLGYDTIYDISGAPPHAMFPLAKLAWLKEHQPHTIQNTAKIYCVGNYLLARMGLPAPIDPSLASRTQLFDIRSRHWSPKLYQAIGLVPEVLPDIEHSHYVVGQLAGETAKLLKLAPGTAVIVGGHDQTCAALGLGITKPGIVGDSAGTYECLTISDTKPHLEPLAKASSLNRYCHVVPGQYITLGFFPSGVMMRWFISELCGVDDNDVAKYCQELEQQAKLKPSGLKVTPYLVGACTPKWDPAATASISGLNLSSTRASIYRGILEGIALELAANISVLEKIVGPVEEINLAGGGMNSLLGLSLRATITKKTINLLHTSEASCLGAAMLAGVGINTFSNLEEAQSSMIHYTNKVFPEINV